MAGLLIQKSTEKLIFFKLKTEIISSYIHSTLPSEIVEKIK